MGLFSPEFPPAKRPARARLGTLTLVVMAAHVLALYHLPATWAAPANVELAREPVQVHATITRAVPTSTPVATHPALPATRHTPPTAVARSQDSAPMPQHMPLASVQASTQEDAILVAAADTRAPDPVPSSPATPVRDAVTLRTSYLPEPVRLKYDIRGEARGFPYSVDGELLWQHDGSHYEARLAISHFLLGSRVQTSKGDLGPYGLEPLRFGDKVRSEVAAHFDRSKTRVTFSANTPDVALQAGAQDQLSVFMQLAALFGTAPQRFPTGSTIPFQAIGPRSAEDWVFKVEGPEKLSLAGTEVPTIKLSRAAIGDFDARGEVWLAPGMGYMPARIRITQSNGDFIDQRWVASQKP